MSTLLKLLILAAIAVGAYIYFVPGSYEAVKKETPPPKKIDPITGKPLVACPTCGATGLARCTARGCVDGKVECDGPCLRLTKGRWVKNADYGHGPDELWFVFPKNKGYAAVTKAHVGEVWEIKDGIATSLGKCKICGGTTRMDCKICKGTGQVACKTCHGQKEISDPTAPAPANPLTPATAPVASLPSSKPSAPAATLQSIRLKNGTTVEGTIIIRDTDFIVVRTGGGKSRQIFKSDLTSP